MKPLNFSLFIENRITNIQSSDSLAFALAVGFGPWIVPVAGAAIFGYSLFVWAPVDMGKLRLVAAVAAAVGLVIAGAISSHNAIASEDARSWRLVYGYILLEIAGLWFMSVGWDVKIVGTVVALLTLIVYLARASTKELSQARDEAKEAETKEADRIKETAQTKLEFQMEQAQLNAEHKRTLEVQAADLKHAERLAKIEAKSVPVSVRETVPANSPNRTLDILKTDIIAELGQEKPNMSALATRLNIGRTTLYKHLGTLAKQGKVVKNGNGYEPINL